MLALFSPPVKFVLDKVLACLFMHAKSLYKPRFQMSSFFVYYFLHIFLYKISCLLLFCNKQLHIVFSSHCSHKKLTARSENTCCQFFRKSKIFYFQKTISLLQLQFQILHCTLFQKILLLQKNEL